MICKIINFTKVKQENHLPYFIVEAIGIENEKNAELFDEDDYWNPLPRFVKKLFPPTELQADALEKRCIDSNGKVLGNAPFIRLMSYQWAAPFPFFILKPNSFTGVCEIVEKTEEFRMKHGKIVTVLKTKYIPRVFTFTTTTLLETADGKCAENGGDADGLCQKAFENAVASGYFLSQKSATNIKEFIEIEEIDELERGIRNKYDEWKDYYNNDYYNDGLDMDQQDERFWNF